MQGSMGIFCALLYALKTAGIQRIVQRFAAAVTVTIELGLYIYNIIIMMLQREIISPAYTFRLNALFNVGISPVLTRFSPLDIF
jgi:hypothetical protein